ncbi:ABC-type Na+ efflux pump, permease component [Ferrimonas balearica DSM 9799]|uniref:ABC-type Na+ efflux pump, permease component n=1 Tax=Ferrimonas balearica (strain DSM 9799 / CCM 4581 / KCTC 23876 / PAT) TaxID=550540 RepID=E1SP64_FERBD|nr:ABC transporter permease [Ferrimonas balearica]ADN75689.1 ABC-type Na+ efflux pump, permease component [Ferrimonas balearica DSM 9799]MBW3138588.1 ABC transporter permease [Ferrimonas balearica]MBY5979357.1 ABC transporter permease [Ferrimonas balearica]
MIALIWLKEMREVLRDKKTLWFVVLFPTVLLPALMGGAIYVGASSVKQVYESDLRFQLVAPEPWRGEIAEALTNGERLVWDDQVQVSNREQFDAAINEGVLEFVLVVPDDFSATASEVSQWQLYYNQADDVGQFDRIHQALQPLFEQWQTEHRNAWNLTESQVQVLKQAVELEQVGVADQREFIGEKVGGFLPYALLLLCLMGALLPALDLGAGEKERGTLETLLMAPVSKTTVVMAKFMVIAICSLTVALLTMASGVVWSLVLGQVFAIEMLVEAISTIGMMDLVLILLLLLPIAMFFAALLLAVSFYARTYKEGQNYVAPLNFVAILPAMVALFPGITLTSTLAWIPLVNVTLASKALLKGTFDYWQLMPIMASNTLLAALLLAFCVKWCSREQVLFR